MLSVIDATSKLATYNTADQALIKSLANAWLFIAVNARRNANRISRPMRNAKTLGCMH